MKTQTTSNRCERCGSANPADAHFCIECGYSLEAAATGATTRLEGRPCLNCRTINPEDARFCVVCGRSFDKPAAPRPPQPPRASMPPAPRPSLPRTYSRAHTHHAPHPTHGINPAAIMIIGVLVLIATHTFWPGILLLVGITAYVSSTQAGRFQQGLHALVWLGGLTVLFAFHALWPGILILAGVNWALAR